MKDVTVKFVNQTGDVFVQANVVTLCTWILDYYSVNGVELHHTSEAPQAGKEKTGSTTLLKNSVNNWDLDFTNTTGVKQSYKATLSWHVKDAAGAWHELADKWVIEEDLESQESKTEKGRAIFTNS